MARTRLKGAERKASIIAVAKRLFARAGYHGVSVDEIAREVGVSPAILYQHYRSKETLYQDVLSEMSCRRDSYRDAIFAGPTDFASLLTRMTVRFVRSMLDDPDYIRIELLSALDGTAAAQHVFGNRWRHFTDYIRYEIEEAAQRGERPVADVDAVCLLFRGMVRELVYARAVLGEEPYCRGDVDAQVGTLVSMFMRALGLAQAVSQ
ncbi:MAG: TetR/AcrR family transcriptional regulator [Magnetospirillum sp.]|nr:TetR/AcrR family transcriptional regulator [Magnetospirillum sp.]